MSWTNRCIVRIGSFLFALVLLVTSITAARADGNVPVYLYDNKSLPISHAQSVGGNVAIAVDDPGLRELLRDIGAALTWNPGERYILFTTAQPQIVSFAIGDTRYDVGPLSSQARFAPFEQGGTAYVPLDELLHALSLAPKRDGNAIVIQPQLAAIDVQSSGGSARIVARGGVPLHARVISENPESLIYAFDGVGTTLERTREVRAGGIREIDVTQGGTVREPTTTVTITLMSGATHEAPASDDGRDFTIALAGAGMAPAQSQVANAPAPPVVNAPAPTVSATPSETAPPITPAPEPSNAQITAVTEQALAGGFGVNISIAGSATYEWHRLRAPDNRFWIDITGAQLQMPPRDDPGGGNVSGLRIRQIDPSTVRVALSLTGQKALDVAATPSGLQIVVHDEDAAEDVARTGNGAIGNAAVAANEPIGAAPPAAAGGVWKFGPHSTYVAANPRLIVIDPGHGGSDPGSVHSMREADLTLDMARRLRDLLIARGWQVRLTRATDVDVYAPNDSAHQELQARDDVANNNGARLLVSIHVNSYINSGPHGTTTYYSKPSDVPLAQTVQRDLIAQLGTADDGIIKSHLYVTLHANMPAILVETAFLSNPDDYARLSSPDWRQKVAKAIADGIGDYAGTPPSQSGDQ